jgi:hypothetical protein
MSATAVNKIPKSDPRAPLGRFIESPPDSWILAQTHLAGSTALGDGDEHRRQEIELEALTAASKARAAHSLLDQRPLPSAHLVSQLRRDYRNSLLCTQFMLYVPFVVLFLLYFIVGRPVEPAYWLRRQLTETGMGNQFAPLSSIWELRPGEADTYYTERTLGTDMYSVNDMHAWLQSVVAPYLWDSQNPDVPRSTGSIAVGMNILLGSARLRALSVLGGSCRVNSDVISEQAGYAEIPSMKPTVNVGGGGCYAAYSQPATNTSALAAAAGTPFLSSFPYKTCETTDRLIRDLGTYACDGNILDIPFSESYTSAVRRLNMARAVAHSGLGLLSESLISTRLLNLQFFSFSPEPRLYMFTEVAVEVAAGGGLVTSTRSRAFVLYHGDSAYTAAVIYFAFFAAFTVFCFVVLLAECVWIVRYERLLNLFTLWRLLELTNFGVLFADFAVNILWVAESAAVREKVTAAIPDGNPQSFGNAYPAALERICVLYTTKRHLNAFNVVVMCLLFIKYASRWSSISRAISAARSDLIGILAIFALIVVSYAMSGVILFGHLMDRYSSFSRAVSSTMRILVGDFSYEDMKMANPVLAALYFWSYNILAIFMMLNFFVGALKNAYSDERKRLEDSNDPVELAESPSHLARVAWIAFTDLLRDLRSHPLLAIKLLLMRIKSKFFEQRDMHLLILAINTIRYRSLLSEHNDEWPYQDERDDNMFLEHVDDLLGTPLVTKTMILEVAGELARGHGYDDGTVNMKISGAHHLLNHCWGPWATMVDTSLLGNAQVTELTDLISATVTETLDRMLGRATWPQLRSGLTASNKKNWTSVLAVSEMFLPQAVVEGELVKAHHALLRLEVALLRNAKAVIVGDGSRDGRRLSASSSSEEDEAHPSS